MVDIWNGMQHVNSLKLTRKTFENRRRKSQFAPSFISSSIEQINIRTLMLPLKSCSRNFAQNLLRHTIRQNSTL
ncbi:hypothetical protein CDL12_03171 [Handroanthus impetiginosus]|uniref:Uncharacterized protein n=1 Tax=Handroanthus impetiginosus TaxID=429701 RepID=A0A2G9HG40_9LAMI|nr:hypothetical protein CDL12_10844 [Handroanthus impetiginosus]PIN24116.1 hypothetical protein CDL12_03171 [Handroanthus impetiginosus]